MLRNIWDHAQDALSIIFKITPDNMISRFCGARETVELLSFNAKRGQAKYEDIKKKKKNYNIFSIQFSLVASDFGTLMHEFIEKKN